MTDLEPKTPHADTDPRRRPDPERVNIPEGLRRARKSPYGPSGRHTEPVEPETSRHADGRQVAKKE